MKQLREKDSVRVVNINGTAYDPFVLQRTTLTGPNSVDATPEETDEN